MGPVDHAARRLPHQGLEDTAGRLAQVLQAPRDRPLLQAVLSSRRCAATTPGWGWDYTDEEKAALTHAFTKKYRKYAGVTSLITPIGGIALITGLMLCWTGQTVAQWLMVPNGPAVPGALPLPAVTAFLGGLMWVLNDHATRWPSWDFGKAEITFSFLRLLMSVPLGYSLAAFGTKDLMPAVAFLIGTFPTATLVSFGRRLVSKQLSLDPEAEGKITALQALPAIDSRKAEIFFQARISNLFELAYADPLLVTVQTNLPFIYVTECVAQALLGRYLGGEGLEKVRVYGLCGSEEALGLWKRLTAADTAIQQQADQQLSGIARALGQGDTAGVRAVLYGVAGDPHALFLSELWRLAAGL